MHHHNILHIFLFTNMSTHFKHISTNIIVIFVQEISFTPDGLTWISNPLLSFSRSSDNHKFKEFLHEYCEELDMCLRNIDAPCGNKVKIWQKS